jgi:hypothetical protein
MDRGPVLNTVRFISDIYSVSILLDHTSDKKYRTDVLLLCLTAVMFLVNRFVFVW